MPNQWFNQFNNYHSIFSPYPRANKSFDITIKIRVRAFESDAEKWAAFEAQYPGESADDFYAYTVVEDLEAAAPEFTLWMDLRHYGTKGLWPVHTLGHEVLHALAYARAVQLEETFPPSDMVDADQLTSLEDAVAEGAVSTFNLSSGTSASTSLGDNTMDRSKRMIGVTADWYSVTILGSTNGPFTVYIGGTAYSITTDTTISQGSDADGGGITPGEDVYVYACLVDGAVVYKMSMSATVPSGFTTDTSTLIGGFHTLCADAQPIPYEWQANTGVWHGQLCVPTGATGYSSYKYRAQYQGVTGATEPTWPTTPGLAVSDGTTIWHCVEMGMSGRYIGNVIPASIWDLTHRARCLNNAGMTFDEKTGLWVDIYLASGTGGNTVSNNGGTIATNNRWTTAVSYGHAVGKRLLTDHEFQSAAEGVWEETQYYGTAAPTTTGGNTGLFILTLDSAPVPADFSPGTGQLTGATSGAVCRVLYKISSTQYLCKNLSLFARFTDGEVISDGTNSRDCGTGYPQYATSARGRIVSNIGCEDIVGVYDQWLLDQGFMIVGADYATAKTFSTTDLEDQRGTLYAQSEAKMVAGGYYQDGFNCGSLSRKISTGRNTQSATIAARYCCEEL